MGLENGIHIEESETGSNSALFLSADVQGERRRTFVFKRTRLLENFGVPQNEGAKREQLAYLLDEDHIACVPPTFYVDFSAFMHPYQSRFSTLKSLYPLGIGSLQYYEIGSSHYRPIYRISAKIQEDLRAILIYNLAILNLDVQVLTGEGGRLISIDHGYSLPQILNRKPDTGYGCDGSPFSEKEKEYIQKLSSVQFAHVLQEHGLSAETVQLQQAILQMLKIATKTNHITLGHLLSLFYGGKGHGGSYESYYYVDFRPELTAIMSAKTEEGRLAAMQQVFKIAQSEDKHA